MLLKNATELQKNWPYALLSDMSERQSLAVTPEEPQNHHNSHHYEHHHGAHEHTHPFPPEEENLLLSLSDQWNNATLPIGQRLEADQVLALEKQYGITDIESRLGRRILPRQARGYTTVLQVFAEQHSSLPTTHPLFDHDSHAHSHSSAHEGAHNCGKAHGPVRRRLDKLESTVLGRIGNKRVHAIAAAAFRLSALTLCPGDDIMAIGAQVYGSISGHVDSHGSHDHEEQAILPARPRIEIEIDLEANKATVLRV